MSSAVHPLEENGINGHKEVLRISPNGMAEILIEVLVLGGIEFIKCLGMVNIERRDKSGFGLRPLVLQLFGIRIEHRA